MNSILQSRRSVIAAVALGALAPAPSADCSELRPVVPTRSGDAVSPEYHREFQRGDAARLVEFRDRLNHLCLVVAPVEGPFVRIAHARDIVDAVIRDLRMHPVVRVPGSEAQLLADVEKRLSRINDERRLIETHQRQAAQLVGLARAEKVPDWLLHSCRELTALGRDAFERWRIGDDWRIELVQAEEEYRPRKHLVDLWSEVRTSLAQASNFSHSEDERFSRSFSESLAKLTREAQSVEASLRDGPGGEAIQRWADVQRSKGSAATELNGIYYRLANDPVYRAQAYQAGRFESMVSTVSDGVYVVLWGVALVFGAMVVDAVRQGRERSARLLSPRHRPPRELTDEERSRIGTRW